MSKLLVCIGIGVVLSAPAFAEADEGKGELVRDIVGAWKARQSQVRTLTCSTEVETFYPRGWMQDAELDPRAKAKWGDRVVPEEDTRFTGESCSWAFDFAKQRVRKESTLTGPWGMPGDQVFHKSHDLQFFKDGSASGFHPGQTEGERHDPKTGALRVDAALGEEGGDDMFLSFEDLPLLWCAGGVNGRYPRPTEMLYLEEPGRFTYRGEVLWKERRCVVLAVREQESSTSVREYWVDAEPPYLIRSCRSRDGDLPFFQIDVEYRDALAFPTSWTLRAYNCPFGGKLFKTMTFSVRNREVNAALPEEFFSKALEPGMIVQTSRNETLEVANDGSLVPLRLVYPPGGQRVHFLVWWGGIGLVLLVVGTGFAWRRHRRSKPVP
jgi:hypothetical protein